MIDLRDVLHELVRVALRETAGDDELRGAGLLEFRDAETSGTLCLDTSDRAVRKRFEEQARVRQRNLELLFSRHGIDHIVLKTDRSFVVPLLRFFQNRVKRFR